MDRYTRKTNGFDYYSYCRYIEKTNEVLERDEKPLEFEEYYKQEPYKSEYDNEDILNRLGELEDLQEELGCPLEVVLKAMIEGIHIQAEFLDLTIKDFILKPRLYFSDDFKCYCLETGYGANMIKLKDYQKTWWLKGEKYE